MIDAVQKGSNLPFEPAVQYNFVCTFCNVLYGFACNIIIVKIIQAVYGLVSFRLICFPIQTCVHKPCLLYNELVKKRY